LIGAWQDIIGSSRRPELIGAWLDIIGSRWPELIGAWLYIIGSRWPELIGGQRDHLSTLATYAPIGLTIHLYCVDRWPELISGQGPDSQRKLTTIFILSFL